MKNNLNTNQVKLPFGLKDGKLIHISNIPSGLACECVCASCQCSGLSRQKGVEILEDHLMRNHVHICLSIPPKFPVSNVVGYLKGKSAIAIACKFRGKQRNFTGENFWARGYFVSTIGLDEKVVRN